MKAVKIAVILMSLLLVIGFAIVIVTVLSRMQESKDQAVQIETITSPIPGSSAVAISKSSPVSANFALSDGEKITETHLSATHLLVRVENSEDRQQDRFILHSLQHQTQSAIYLYQ